MYSFVIWSLYFYSNSFLTLNLAKLPAIISSRLPVATMNNVILMLPAFFFSLGFYCFIDISELVW